MRVAAIQMNSGPDPDKNLNEAFRLLQAAIEKEVELIAFPENFSLFTNNSEDYLEGAQTLRGLTISTLQEWAADYEVAILAGSLPLVSRASTKKVTNTSVLISEDGEVLAKYDKIHLFDVLVNGESKYQESDDVLAGKKVVTAKTRWGKMGLSVCYDLRFPELYRQQSKAGAEVLFIPSAFTRATGRAHWDVLTRARAIENLAYVIAPAQTGSPYPGRETHGHTRIVDPWGKVIAERPAGPGVVWARLDFAALKKIRTDFPVLQSRKLRS
jgi:predicted amidohydrolase